MRLFGENVFFYGAFYDSDWGNVPSIEKRDIVIYANLNTERNRVIASLEGVFISDLEDPFRNFKGNPVCIRTYTQMTKFQEKYKGKFISFNI